MGRVGNELGVSGEREESEWGGWGEWKMIGEREGSE